MCRLSAHCSQKMFFMNRFQYSITCCSGRFTLDRCQNYTVVVALPSSVARILQWLSLYPRPLPEFYSGGRFTLDSSQILPEFCSCMVALPLTGCSNYAVHASSTPDRLLEFCSAPPPTGCPSSAVHASSTLDRLPGFCSAWSLHLRPTARVLQCMVAPPPTGCPSSAVHARSTPRQSDHLIWNIYLHNETIFQPSYFPVSHGVLRYR